MPNHVTTRCLVSGPEADIREFRNRALREKDGETIFDFNGFIPMPAVIGETISGTTAIEGAALLCVLEGRAPPQGRIINACNISRARIDFMRQDLAMPNGPLRELAKAWLAKYPEFRDHGEKRLRVFIETGFPDWYEWSIHHWGTKWNAYHFCIATTEPLEFYFDTAWNFPLPLFGHIAARFPKLAFHCTCFDEGWNFAGDGFFNAPSGQSRFSICDATPELYERVYGEAWQPES